MGHGDQTHWYSQSRGWTMTLYSLPSLTIFSHPKPYLEPWMCLQQPPYSFWKLNQRLSLSLSNTLVLLLASISLENVYISCVPNNPDAKCPLKIPNDSLRSLTHSKDGWSWITISVSTMSKENVFYTWNTKSHFDPLALVSLIYKFLFFFPYFLIIISQI